MKKKNSPIKTNLLARVKEQFASGTFKSAMKNLPDQFNEIATMIETRLSLTEAKEMLLLGTDFDIINEEDFFSISMTLVKQNGIMYASSIYIESGDHKLSFTIFEVTKTITFDSKNRYTNGLLRKYLFYQHISGK